VEGVRGRVQRVACTTAGAAAARFPRPCPRAETAADAAVDRNRPGKPAAKLTYKETRQLEQLPARIEALEQEQQALTARMSAADYHALGRSGSALTDCVARPSTRNSKKRSRAGRNSRHGWHR